MDGSAVHERERGVLLTEGQCKIGPAKHDCLGVILFEQLSANSVEDQTLGLSHMTGRRHRNVGLVHIVQVLWWDDLGAADASIESRLRSGASSEDSDPFEAAFLDGPANLGNYVDNGQRGYRFKGIDAKVSGNRSDHDAFGTRRDEAVREPRVDDYLRWGVIACEIAGKRWCVSMHHRQLQRRFLTGERIAAGPIPPISPMCISQTSISVAVTLRDGNLKCSTKQISDNAAMSLDGPCMPLAAVTLNRRHARRFPALCFLPCCPVRYPLQLCAVPLSSMP
jgi:hypothetical protein